MNRVIFLFLLAISASGHARGADGEPRPDPVALYMAGRYTFQQHCVVCHGSTGRGNGPWAAGLDVKPRNFRTGLFKYRTTPYGKLPVDEDLRRIIRGGISGTAMPMFARLREEELAALLVYLKQLSRSWNDPALAASPLPIPEVPGWFANPTEKAAHAKRGAVRFATTCAVCHGESGRGDGPGGGGLLDAWGFPIRPADLQAPHLKSGDSPRDVYRTVATGLNGTPMIGFAELLTPEDIWELVAFLHR